MSLSYLWSKAPLTVITSNVVKISRRFGWRKVGNLPSLIDVRLHHFCMSNRIDKVFVLTPPVVFLNKKNILRAFKTHGEVEMLFQKAYIILSEIVLLKTNP